VKKIITLATALAASVLLTGCVGMALHLARQPDSLRELNNLAACYTEGIDEIGNDRTDDGAKQWQQCFTEDVRFTLTFGTFTMTCPGEKCPLPASMTGLARRVAAARGTYDRAGYVATSHHLTSLLVEPQGADSARIKAHLQAWHQRRDGVTVLGLGTWEVQARRTSAGWRITEEKLDSPMRVVIPKGE
jgi:hypothetical protein